MDDKPTIQDAIGYSFEGITCVPFIESIIQELGIESNKYWMRPAEIGDWYATGDYVITQTEPKLIEEYELVYDMPYTEQTKNRVLFAGHLIDSMLEYIGYIEGCYEKEDNKKGGTS